MKLSSSVLSLSLLTLAAGSVPIESNGGAGACAESKQAGSSVAAAAASSAPAAMLSDDPLADSQVKLLELAFDAASRFPLHPHVKNRSKAQDQAVAACIELGQLRRAGTYIEGIVNWRQGACYADLAYACVDRGASEEDVHTFLDRARRAASDIAEQEPPSSGTEALMTGQDWQRDRILVKIARAYEKLGKPAEAARLEAGVAISESGKVDAVRAMHAEADDYDAQVTSLDAIVTAGGFDQIRHALDAYAQLFGRFYADTERRASLEGKIEAAWSKLPPTIRVEVLEVMTGFALAAEDRAKALELVSKARAILEAAGISAEVEIPYRARLAVLRHRAGESSDAKHDVDAVLASYSGASESIVNIYRGGVLRPIAEAYMRLGHPELASAVYTRAIEEGVVNPNSRPRAEDLVATCCSMAVFGFQPDDPLWTRMLEIGAKLGDPW